MVIIFITRDGDDDMNISYMNSNKTTSLPVELDALNNKDFSYVKDFFLYIETQLKIAKDFCRPGEEVSSSIASKVFHAFI
ncbi:signal peptide-binding chaperone for NapA [Shigella dysenteriae 225-75]|nr:signal peptide-binding chaperone for NapA [Shigella dysenteriae 225-75]